MNRASFFRLLGKGAAVLALAPSVLARVETAAFNTKKLQSQLDRIRSYRIGGRTFHVAPSPFDNKDIDNAMGKLVKEHGSVEYLHFAGQHEEKMIKKYWEDYEKAMLTDPKAFHDYIDKL